MKKLILIFLLGIGVLFAAEAQTYVADLKSTFGFTVDTVTNTATAYLTSAPITVDHNIVTVQAVVTELAGTTGGTLTLMGSLDDTGDNFVALLAGETSTAIPTKTALDVATAQTFLFQVKQNPCKRYRVSYTGTGTMSAKFSAKILTRPYN